MSYNSPNVLTGCDVPAKRKSASVSTFNTYTDHVTRSNSTKCWGVSAANSSSGKINHILFNYVIYFWV